MTADTMDEHFELYAELLRLDGKEGAAVAREKAARIVDRMNHLPPNPATLDGIGDTLRREISLLKRGEYPEQYERLREEYDWYLTLREVDYIGPSRARTIHDTFSCETIDKLLLIGEDLTIVDGIGPATAERIIRSARELQAER